MKFNNGLLAFVIITLTCLQCKPSSESDADSQMKTPNIILIISDDQGWSHYSFMGHEHIQTPSIDRLAREGITFTRGYSVAPLCRPSLASIATGLYPHQHGILGNDPLFEYDRERNWGLDWRMARVEYNQPLVEDFRKLETIPDVLKQAGYVSLQTGKWWEGDYTNGGFDEGMTHGDPEKEGRHGDKGLEIGRNGLDVIYDFIDSTSQNETPFFVWYAPFLPHNPHNPPDSLRNKYLSTAPTEPVANYWATIEWFDITCGQLMDYVDEKELGEETIFVYVTDNGWIQDPERPNRYAPRSKRTPYEMGIRTPIIFRWKGSLKPAMNEKALVSSIDIAPTIYALCGLDIPPDLQGMHVLDGASLQNRDSIFAETYSHDFTTIEASLYSRTIIEDEWKLILPDAENRPDDAPELYQIIDDPNEQENLADQYPQKVAELSKSIQYWWNEK
jgi:arylsulfatase A-like enzyme